MTDTTNVRFQKKNTNKNPRPAHSRGTMYGNPFGLPVHRPLALRLSEALRDFVHQLVLQKEKPFAKPVGVVRKLKSKYGKKNKE